MANRLARKLSIGVSLNVTLSVYKRTSNLLHLCTDGNKMDSKVVALLSMLALLLPTTIFGQSYKWHTGEVVEEKKQAAKGYDLKRDARQATTMPTTSDLYVAETTKTNVTVYFDKYHKLLKNNFSQYWTATVQVTWSTIALTVSAH